MGVQHGLCIATDSIDVYGMTLHCFGVFVMMPSSVSVSLPSAEIHKMRSTVVLAQEGNQGNKVYKHPGTRYNCPTPQTKQYLIMLILYKDTTWGHNPFPLPHPTGTQAGDVDSPDVTGHKCGIFSTRLTLVFLRTPGICLRFLSDFNTKCNSIYK